MGKTRVYEVAKAIGLDKEELVMRINALKLGFTVKNYMSVMSDDQADLVRNTIERERRRSVVEERIRPTVIRRRNRGEATNGDPTVRRRRPRKSEEGTAVAASGGSGNSDNDAAERMAAQAAAIEAEAKAKAEAEAKAKAEAEAKAKAEAEAKAKAEAQAEAEAAEAEAVAAAEQAKAQAEAEAEAKAAVVAARAEAAAAEKVRAEAEAKAAADAARAGSDAGSDEVDAPVQATVVAAAGEDEDGPSNIAGFIDPEIIRKRLAKDNKTFAPGGKGGRLDRAERAEKRTKGRKVVERPSLYGSGGGARPSSRSNRRNKRKNSKSGPIERTQITQAAEHKRVLKIEEAITVGELAHGMGVKAGEVIRKLMAQGMMMTVNQSLDADTANLIAQEFDFTVEDVGFKEEELLVSEVDNPEDLKLRAPVVTVMGHVDHGKTSLLDAIRDTKVISGEAGGITQHIGASTVETPGGRIVFLDTPGHEAFTALRARGAKVTDVVILVVAADDGVMPQTVEAINHARAASVPIIVAVNKIDKPGANPMRVKQALAEYELVPEDWGGSTIFVEVSALKGDGIEDLLEMLLLQSEILELKANPNKAARGIVLEARKDIGRGTLATIIVQEGTLEVGDIVVTGATYGRVRTMSNERGSDLTTAGPSTAVEITGLSDVPEAGDAFFVSEDEKTAKQFTQHVSTGRRQAELASKRFDPWAALKETKRLPIIIKGDVQGSVEALKQSLEKLSTDEVQVEIIHTGVGGITESDVQLAAASSAIVVGFNTRPEARASDLAKREGVEFELHSVIYDVLDRARRAMEGMLDPIYEERELGQVEVRETFSVPKIGTIAGCYVTDGKVIRGCKARVVRNGNVLSDSRVSSLRRFKDDVKEVKAGFECGLSIDNFNDIRVGDRIEVYELQAVAATL